MTDDAAAPRRMAQMDPQDILLVDAHIARREADLAEALGRTQVQERLLIDLASAAEYHITVGGHDGMAALDYMVKRVRAFLAAHPVAK